MSVEVDVWYVKLADGDVDRVTLDQLDEAFQSGQIDENSMVLAAGTDQWMKLGELLQASDATPPPPQPTPTPSVTAQAVAPARPVAQPLAQPTAMVRPASPLQAPVQPVIATAPPPAQSNVPVANTLRPMSFDLEADDVQFPRGRSGKGKLVAAVAVVVLGAAAFVVVKRGALNASADTSAPAFAAAAQTPAPPPPPAETAAPTPPTPMQASMGGASSVMDPTRMDGTQRFSDAQKAKLLEADKKVKTHEHSHGGGGAVSHNASGSRSKSSPAFTTTGNKYDPLNSSL
jgi:uncharacterized protein DUF4339